MIIVYATDNYWPRISGMAVSIETFKLELEKRGHEVHVLCPNYPDADVSDINMQRTNIHRFSSYDLSFLLNTEDSMVHLFEAAKVSETLKRINPDIIHIQTEFTMGRFALDYARKRHIPLLATSHTHFEEYIKIYFPFIPKYLGAKYVRIRSRRTFNKCDCLIVPSESIKRVHLRNGVHVPVHTVPTGINKELFEDPDPEIVKNFLKTNYPQALGRKTLLYAGRLGIEKNLHFLLDVLYEIKKSIPDIILFIIGEGPIRDALEYIIHRKGLKDNVCFLGYIQHSNMKHFYAYSDVFTFPSKTETQGLVTVESMLCGTPVVGVGEMGTKFIMKGDNGGFMVDEDLEQFKSRVVELLTDDELYRRKSDEARAHSQQFTIEVVTDMMEKIYTQEKDNKRRRLFNFRKN